MGRAPYNPRLKRNVAKLSKIRDHARHSGIFEATRLCRQCNRWQTARPLAVGRTLQPVVEHEMWAKILTIRDQTPLGKGGRDLHLRVPRIECGDGATSFDEMWKRSSSAKSLGKARRRTGRNGRPWKRASSNESYGIVSRRNYRWVAFSVRPPVRFGRAWRCSDVLGASGKVTILERYVSRAAYLSMRPFSVVAGGAIPCEPTMAKSSCRYAQLIILRRQRLSGTQTPSLGSDRVSESSQYS